MIHLDPAIGNAKPELKQVEFNTVSVSMGGLAAQASKLHQSVLFVKIGASG